MTQSDMIAAIKPLHSGFHELRREHQKPSTIKPGKASEYVTMAAATIQRITPKGDIYQLQVERVLNDGTLGDYAKAEQLFGIANALRATVVAGNSATPQSDVPAFRAVEKLLTRFHKVARQLLVRNNHKDTLNILDEYDVQDLLHALLLIDFDDIRPEEWTPSYAGGSNKMDFLLKREKIVIETKFTREGRGDKKIGDELLVDIPHYREHGDCNTLVCFVYDPGQHIRNPAGLKFDLEKNSTETFTVAIAICPLH